MHKIPVHLTLSRDAGSVTARILVENKTTGPLLLEKSKFGKLEGVFPNVFQCFADGQPAKFTGVLRKLNEPQPEDFISLPRGESLTFEFHGLEKQYAIPAGTTRLEVRFRCLVVPIGSEQVFEYASPAATL